MALKLQDLIDIEQFQMLQDRLNEIYAFPSAIIDNDGVILTATAWQDICTKFHRKNDASLQECIKSDRYIADHLQEANPCVSYRCPHGLIDNATPIIIDGVHYGNFFTGQFFLEPPDIDFFRAQAKRYGFAEEAYLAAVRKVPIWSQQQRDSYLFFIKGLIEVITGIGLKNLRESEIREQFRESEARFRAILQTAMDGFMLTDLQGRILESNETYQRMSGYSGPELLAMQLADLEVAEQAEQRAAHRERIVAIGAHRYETRHRHRDGHLFDVEVSVQYRPVRAGQLVAFIRDIGEQKRAEEEKARSRKAAERLAEEMATIAEIGRVVGATLDIDTVYERVAAAVRRLIPCDRFLICRKQPGENEFTIAYAEGTDNPGRRIGDVYPSRGTAFGLAMAKQAGVLIQPEDAEEIREFENLYNTFKTGLRSTMIVPLISLDEVIGSMNIRSGKLKAYSERDLRLAEQIGIQVAGAIVNAQRFTELQENRRATERLAEEMATLAEIGRIVGATPDIEQVYDRFAAVTRQLIPFDTLSVNLLDASQSHFRIAHLSGADLPDRTRGLVIAAAGSMTGYVVNQRRAVIMKGSSAAEIARLYPGVTQVASIHAGFLSNMLVPLYSSDAMIGVLHFRARGANVYGDADLRLAERIGMQIAGAIANAQLFTDLRQAEKALRESEERFRLAFATSPDAISINRLSDGLYLDVNEGFTRLTGYAREAVIGRTTREINIWCDQAGRRKLLRGVQEKGYVENLEGEFRRRDGSIAVALMSARILVLQGVQHVLSITRDISDRKRAEEEQAKLQEQLLQSQKMESIGLLAGGVAHDFNNMLGVILGHLEMAMDEVGPGHRLFNDLREIEKAARRSTDLTRQLLAFARKQTIAPRALDLNETVEEALKMLRRLMGEDIHLAWLPSPGLWTVRMDPSQVDQILANLCVNARDAIDGSGRAGRVTIETRNVTCDAACYAEHGDLLPGDYVCLAVTDNGSGMDGQVLAKLFEPFFTTKTFGKGTGLGLATIYGIIKQNSGFITVDSEPGEGATFRVYLPRHTGPSEAAPDASVAWKTAPVRQGQETILVVEDEPDLLDLTRLMLERQGYRVLTAGMPGEAIRLAEEQSGGIDLLVTDVVMPEMNGQALAERIHALHPGIRCLFTSGYTANVIAHHGILDTGTAFIQKPFSRDALAAKVREVLDRDQAQGPPRL